MKYRLRWDTKWKVWVLFSLAPGTASWTFKRWESAQMHIWQRTATLAYDSTTELLEHIKQIAKLGIRSNEERREYEMRR